MDRYIELNGRIYDMENEQDFSDYMDACQNRAGAALETDAFWDEPKVKPKKAKFAANHTTSPFAHVQFGMAPPLNTEEELKDFGEGIPKEMVSMIGLWQEYRKKDYETNGATPPDQQYLRNPGPPDFLTPAERVVIPYFQNLVGGG